MRSKQNRYIGESVKLTWSKEKNYSKWIIVFKKRSFWFWKNCFLVKNKGALVLLLDQVDFKVRIYSIRFFRLKKLVDYNPNVIKFTLNSLVGAVNIKESLNIQKKFKFNMNSSYIRPIQMNSKLILPQSQINIPYLKQRKWKM